MILPTCFDLLEESLLHREVQFKKFCPPVKTSCPPAVSYVVWMPLLALLGLFLTMHQGYSRQDNNAFTHRTMLYCGIIEA